MWGHSSIVGLKLTLFTQELINVHDVRHSLLTWYNNYYLTHTVTANKFLKKILGEKFGT